MVMRLLKREEGQKLQQLEIAQKQSRSIQLDDVIKDKRKEITELDNHLVNRLANAGTQGLEEEQMWRDRISALTIEVDALESRRKIALVPLEEREKSVHTRESALLRREEIVAIKDSDLEHTKELLEEKLDDVSEREQDAVKYSLILNNREFTIKTKEEEVEKRMDAVTDLMKQHMEENEKTKADLASQKAILRGRDVSITEREQIVAKKEAGFADREKRIADRYATLQRAITEINLRKK